MRANSPSIPNPLRLGVFARACLLLPFFAFFAHADDVGISDARLIEKPHGEYLLEADVPPALVSAVRPPIVPDRFALSPKPELLRRGSYITIRYAFSGDEDTPPLSSDDLIVLPWARSGVALNVFWQDHPPQRAIFTAAGPEGIRIPIESLRPTPVTPSGIFKQFLSAGMQQPLSNWLHALLILSFAFLARGRAILTLALCFAAGHALSLVAFDLRIPGPPLPIAQAALALGIIVIARAVLLKNTSPPQPSRFYPLLIVIGLIHGLGVAQMIRTSNDAPGQEIVALFAFNTGIDLFQIGLAVLLAFVTTLIASARPLATPPRFAALVLGALATTLTILSVQAFLTMPPPAAGDQADSLAARLKVQSNTAATPTRASAATPPRSLTTPVMSFVTIDPYEVRHEVLVQVDSFARENIPATIPIEAQENLKQALLTKTLASSTLSIDGTSRAPDHQRADFVDVRPTGVVTRETEKPEDRKTAVLGLSFGWETSGPAQSLELAWQLADLSLTELPVTLAEPTGADQIILTPTEPSLTWKNDDATLAFRSPEIQAIPVTHPRLPLLSSILVIVILIVIVIDKRHPLPASRPLILILLITATVLYPFARTPARIPFIASWQPSPERTTATLEALLTNVYRALDFRNESVIYDQLAVSVTGEQLTQTYLDLTRTLELENRGGARARVDDLEVLEITSAEPTPGGSLTLHAKWRAGGSVSHFGHTHYRQNIYDAILTLTPVDRAWKIQKIELLDEKRIL